MGYELTMRIGWLSAKGPEFKDGPLTLSEDGTELYRPTLKDEKGQFIKTGRTEQTFIEVAHVDLCKIYDTATAKVASDSFLSKEQKAKVKNVIKWYVGNEERDSDSYGDMPTPISPKKVIQALRKDLKGAEPYRRFEWALALCEAVSKSDNGDREFIVLFEGH